MASQKAAKAAPEPLSPEACELLLQAIRHSSEPVLAKAAAAMLVAPFAATEAQVVPVLESYAAAGVLQKYPATTAKGKPRFWDRDLRAVIRESLLRGIHESAVPLTAKDVAKLSVAKVSESDATQILQNAVSNQSLYAIPPAKAKGKTLFWHRDSQALGRAAVIEAAERADEPFTAKELTSRLQAPIKLAEGEVSGILDEAVAVGTLHSIPPVSSKGKPRYWNRDVLEFGSQGALRVINSKGPQSVASLKKGLKGFTETQIKDIVSRLRDQGGLYPQPVLGTAKQELFGTRPPLPAPYFREIGLQLNKTVALLKAAQVPVEELRRTLVQLVEEAGIPFGARAASATPQRPLTAANLTATTGESVDPARGASVDLVALMKWIEPGAERGALVGARELRRSASMQKSEFDQAVLELAQQGRLSLHRHDYVASLSQAERDELVTDDEGGFYVGMALRTG